MSGRREETKDSSALFQFDQIRRLPGVSLLAGVDEAGRGPLAGPVVAAAVVLPPDWFHPLVNDSKQLTPKRRELLAVLIQERALGAGVGMATVEEIDAVNIRQASFLAMIRALDALPNPPDFTLVDGFRIPDWSHPQEAVIGGDGRSLSIAAASILAKVTRDRWMDALAEQYPSYGFDRHRGYGTAAHLAALERFGPCPAHRKTFAPVVRVLSRCSVEPLNS